MRIVYAWINGLVWPIETNSEENGESSANITSKIHSDFLQLL